MLVMTKAILALMIGFIISVIIGLITIPILKKTKIKQVESTYLSKKHKEKSGLLLWEELYLLHQL